MVPVILFEKTRVTLAVVTLSTHHVTQRQPLTLHLRKHTKQNLKETCSEFNLAIHKLDFRTEIENNKENNVFILEGKQ